MPYRIRVAHLLRGQGGAGSNLVIQFTICPLELFCVREILKANIGIAAYPTEGGDRDTLLRLAASAKDYGKNKGGNCFQFSTRTINTLYENRRKIESKLRSALRNDEFYLCYQPQLDIQTNTIMGVEVLLRWKDSDNNIVSPEEFVPVAEETGLIIPIGEWILKKAFSQLAEWHKSGKALINMSVNLSPRQFMDHEFSNIVKEIVKNSTVDPRYLILEITESLLIADTKHTSTLLQGFKDMGIGLSIDDFGIGYSSLSYLCELPIDELKIDRAFISGLPTRTVVPGSSSMVMDLARSSH